MRVSIHPVAPFPKNPATAQESSSGAAAEGKDGKARKARQAEEGASVHEAFVAQASKQVDDATVQRDVLEMNKQLRAFDRRLQFSKHEATGRIIVKVIDTKTDEVIREIPPEKLLDLMSNIMNTSGLLVDKKA